MFARTLYCFLIAVVLVACAKPNRHAERDNALTRNPAYAAYVTSYTGGLISRQDDIVITLASDIADSSFWHKEADASLLTITPKVVGKLIWTDAHTLTFNPDKPLPFGSTYEATINLGKLFDIPDKELKAFDFDIQTRKLALNYEITDVLTPSYRGQFSGVVNTNDYLEPEVLQQLFTFNYLAAKTAISWVHTDDGRTHRFMADDIKLSAGLNELEVVVDGKALNLDGFTEKAVKLYQLPAAGTFAIWLAEPINDPELAVRLHYTQPIKAGQNLESYFQLTGSSPAEVVQDDNTVTMFVNNYNVPMLEVQAGLEAISGAKSLVYKQDQIIIPINEASIQLINTGFITPAIEGKSMVSFMAKGLKSVRVDVAAIAPDDINQIMLHEIHRQYSAGDKSHTLYQDPVIKYGKPIWSRLVNLAAGKSINAPWQQLSNQRYQLDLTDVMVQYPNHLFKVWIREDVGSNQASSQELVWANARDQGDESYGIFDNSMAQIRHYWRTLMQESTAAEGIYERHGQTIYEFGEQESYYEEEAKASAATTLLLNSNLGLIAKQGYMGNVHITATSILKPAGAAGAEISLYDRRLKLIEKLRTDGNGHVIYSGKVQPALVVGSWEKSTTWLPIKEEYMLSTSNFDVSTEVGEGIKGMIYTDRGLYRAGDTIFATLLVQEPTLLQAQAKPVIMSIKDDRGRLLDRKVRAYGTNGFYTFKVVTPVTQASGSYELVGGYAGLSYRKTILLGNKDPNRMNISTRFATEPVVSGGQNVANISANFLFGAPVKGGLVRVTAVAKPKIFIPQSGSLVGYSFAPAAWSNAGGPETEIAQVGLDAQGMASVPFIYTPQPNLMGVLELDVKTIITEQNGQPSEDHRTAFCHTQPYYLGVKATVNNSYEQSRPSTFKIEAALLTPSQQMVTKVDRPLTAQLYKRQSDVWYESNQVGMAVYHNEPLEGLVNTYTLLSKDGKFYFDATVNESNLYDYFLLVKDPNTNQEVKVYLNSHQDETPITNLNPEELNFAKPDQPIEVGQPYHVVLPGEVGTKFLVSIENGMDVLEQQWIEAKTTTTDLNLITKAEWAPNVFINITALRPYLSNDNRQPMRKYGVINLKVINSASHLEPVLSLPKQIKPLDLLEISVSEKAGKAMTYTLAVVDEGLLNMTRFKTPDPHGKFYAPTSLGVRTFDMFDDIVVGEGVNLLDNILKAGGDEFANADAALKNQRFKPIVVFMGPFKLDVNGKANHKLQIPNYFGQLRVMVVAGQDQSYGATEGFVTVKSDLMASLFGPQTAGPNEQLQIPLTLFIENPALTKAQVTLTNSGNLVPSSTTINVSLKGQGEQVVMVPIKTGNQSGMGHITATIIATGVKSLTTLNVPVRQPNLSQSQLLSYQVAAGEQIQATWPNTGLGAKAEVLVAANPRVAWDRVFDRVAKFPHGRSDDAAGSGYTQVLLLKGKCYKDEYRTAILKANVTATIAYLQRFQQQDGLLCYHPNDRTTAIWPSILAFLFLSEAQDLGFEVTELKSGIQNQLAKAIGVYGTESDDALRQAYLGIACLGRMDGSEINKLLETAPLSRLGGSLQILAHAAGKKYKNRYDEIKYLTQYPDLTCLSLFAGLDGLIANALETEALLTMRRQDVALPYMKDVADLLNADLYLDSYQEAFLIRASLAWIASQGVPKPLVFNMSINGTERVVRSLNPSFDWAYSMGTKPAQWTLANKGSKTIIAQVRLTGIPAIGTEKPIAEGISLNYQWTSIDGSIIQTFEAGKPMKLVLTVKNLLVGARQQAIKGQLFIPTGFDVPDDIPKQKGLTITNNGDRLGFGTSLGGGQTSVMEIVLTPRFVGTVRLPSITARAWQGKYYQATTAAQYLTVEPAKYTGN